MKFPRITHKCKNLVLQKARNTHIKMWQRKFSISEKTMQFLTAAE